MNNRIDAIYARQGRDVKPGKAQSLKDQMLVLAPHEGIVPSDIWLTCRKKLMNNMKIQSARKATHTYVRQKNQRTDLWFSFTHYAINRQGIRNRR